MLLGVENCNVCMKKDTYCNDSPLQEHTYHFNVCMLDWWDALPTTDFLFSIA